MLMIEERAATEDEDEVFGGKSATKDSGADVSEKDGRGQIARRPRFDVERGEEEVAVGASRRSVVEPLEVRVAPLP